MFWQLQTRADRQVKRAGGPQMSDENKATDTKWLAAERVLSETDWEPQGGWRMDSAFILTQGNDVLAVVRQANDGAWVAWRKDTRMDREPDATFATFDEAKAACEAAMALNAGVVRGN